MITLHAYWLGRDVTHAEELTDEINRNAKITVERVNQLLDRAGRSGVDEVRSGWRPKAVNDATNNAATSSRHLTAQACDLADPDRALARWCLDHLDDLKEIGLWMEDPRWTQDWVHFQIVPPGSGKLVYIPNNSPPTDPTFA